MTTDVSATFHAVHRRRQRVDEESDSEASEETHKVCFPPQLSEQHVLHSDCYLFNV